MAADKRRQTMPNRRQDQLLQKSVAATVRTVSPEKLPVELKRPDYAQFLPQAKQFQSFVSDWFVEFHKEYMRPAEDDLSELQRELFQVDWANCREKLGADIEGNMTRSVLESHKILKCTCCKPESALDQIARKARENLDAGEGPAKRINLDENHDVDQIPASRENLTILMELMMYSGRDVNVVDLYRLFKTIH